MTKGVSSDQQGVEVALGLGSNRWHGRYGPPKAVLLAAIQVLEAKGLQVSRVSRLIETPPMGPSNRRYANGALRGYWRDSPQALLQLLKQTEREFGRKRGQRWGARVLDLDILVFGNQQVAQRGLNIPHLGLAVRDFVLVPLAEIWPDWRHPKTGLRVRQMLFKIKGPKAVDSTTLIQ